MPQLRTAIIVHGTEPVNIVVLPPDPAGAAAYCSTFDGVCVVPDPSDEYGVDFLTLTGCVAVEVTGLDPMPSVGTGWTLVGSEWIAPVQPDEE
jgi:hypothetical protein